MKKLSVLLILFIAVVNNSLAQVTAVCQPVSMELDSVTGDATIMANQFDGGSTGNGPLTFTINGAPSISLNCSNLGTTSVTLTVVDSAGNSSTCITTATVYDSTSPVAICKDTIHLYLNNSPNDGRAVLHAFYLDNGSSDNCGIASYLINNQASDTFYCQNAGNPHFRVLTVTDVSGNSSTCMSTVVISDPNPPTAVCQNRTVYIPPSGFVTIAATQINDGSTDNCAIQSYNFASGGTTRTYTCADVGVNQLTLNVMDVYGNAAVCNATVTVLDTMPPNVVCSASSIDLTNANSYVMSPTQMGFASDICGIDSVWLSKDTFTCSDIGKTAVTLYASDVNGNINSCTDTVTVSVDMPTAFVNNKANDTLCVGESIALSGGTPANGTTYNHLWTGPSGQITFNPSTTDTTLTNLQGNGSGTYVFSITPQSANGCTVSSSVDILIDDVSPTANCVLNTVVELDSMGFAVVYADDLVTSAADNSGLYHIQVNGMDSIVLTTANVGSNILTITVTDSCGNTTNCNTFVTVNPYSSIPSILSAEQFNIYPVPNVGVFTVQSTTDISEISLYNAVGQLVYHEIYNSKECLVRLDAEAGIYLLKINTKDGLYSSAIQVRK